MLSYWWPKWREPLFGPYRCELRPRGEAVVVVGDFGNLGALLGIVGAFRVSLGFLVWCGVNINILVVVSINKTRKKRFYIPEREASNQCLESGIQDITCFSSWNIEGAKILGNIFEPQGENLWLWLLVKEERRTLLPRRRKPKPPRLHQFPTNTITPSIHSRSNNVKDTGRRWGPGDHGFESLMSLFSPVSNF